MKKIITFFGGDSQVGTTMIAQSVAEIIAKGGNRVALIMASSEYGLDYIDQNQDLSLDDLKTNITNNHLTVEDVKGIMFEHNDISIVPGIKNITTLKYYGEDDIEIMIKPLEKNYDFIIIDAGNNVQYGLSMSALKHSEKRYYVITQQEKSVRRFKNLQQSILGPLNWNGQIIINKYNGNMAFYSPKQIEEIFKTKKAFTISYIEYGWQAESDRSTLLKYPKFAEGIKQIVNDILGQGAEDVPKKTLFKR
ncbi:MAG: hypothetical protein RR313_07025 [Anaerovoracaceae bacterium]